MGLQSYCNRVGFAGGGGQYKDDRLPHYSFEVKQYLVKAKPGRPHRLGVSTVVYVEGLSADTLWDVRPAAPLGLCTILPSPILYGVLHNRKSRWGGGVYCAVVVQ